MVRKATGFIYDESTNTVIPTFEEFDIDQINEMSNERIFICQNCENFNNDDENRLPRCKLCGCALQWKALLIYPLDENAKAFNHIRPTGEKVYVCPLQKW